MLEHPELEDVQNAGASPLWEMAAPIDNRPARP
jgi:hypothetical protein